MCNRGVRDAKRSESLVTEKFKKARGCQRSQEKLPKTA